MSDVRVRVDIEDELERFGAFLGDGSDQAGDEQRSHVVGTSPGHRAIRIVNGLEVEPVGNAGLEIDQDVFRHRVTVGESQAMELGEGDDRPFDRVPSDRLLQFRILQPRRQRVSSEKWEDERPVDIDVNRSTAESPVDLALALLPILLGQDPHAGIQDPRQRITHPDQERRVEEAVLSHLTCAVLKHDPGRRVSRGPKHPPQCQAQFEVGSRREVPHDSSFTAEPAGDYLARVLSDRRRRCARRRREPPRPISGMFEGNRTAGAPFAGWRCAQ